MQRNLEAAVSGRFRNSRTRALAIGLVFLAVGQGTATASENFWVATDSHLASDSNDGLSMAAPFRTLARGVRELSPGDTLFIQKGIYRESLLPEISGNNGLPILIQAVPGDEGLVIIRGSDVVEGWSHDGGGVWSIAWQTLPLITYPDGWPDIDEYARRREMVFIDGNPLKQVLSPENLENGLFYMDDAAGRLRIQAPDDPNDHLVEVSVRTHGVSSRSSNHVTYRGLRVDHVSTEIWDGAMSLGPFTRVEDCTIEQNNGIGIDAESNTEILRSTSNHNGRIGINLAGNNSHLESNETSDNSWRYGPRWAAGGVKIIGGGRPSGNRLLRHISKNNNGPGLHIDTAGSGNRVESSVFEDNRMWGLAFEATIGPNWAINNVVTGTKIGGVPFEEEDGAGIVMRDSRDTFVINNTVVGVEGAGVLIAGNERNNGEFFAANTTVVNNIIANSGTIAVHFWLWDQAVLEPRIGSHILNHNLYYANPTTVLFADFSNGQWINWRQWTLSEWQSNSGQDINSLESPPNFKDPGLRDFRLQATSPAIDAGLPTPLVVEDAAGISRPSGAGLDIGAYELPQARSLPRRPTGRIKP